MGKKAKGWGVKWVLWGFFLSSTLIHGQVNTKSSLSLLELLKVNLTTGSFLELDSMNSAVSMTVISKKQIKHSGARHLSELLEIYVPGFQYMQNKWNGEIWGMRGVATSRNTKVIYLVNGHKMNSESRDGAFTDLNLGLLGDVERVEVLRGPAGLVYGSGAIAGVVNVVTKKYDGLDLVEVIAQVGTWNLATTAQQYEANLFKEFGDEQKISVHMGYLESEGVGQEETRVTGKAHWPFPHWRDDVPENGLPSAGSAWSTPGNWKMGLNYEVGNLKVYTRFSHQVANAGGLFPLDPWPSTNGLLQEGAPALVDGENRSAESFWGETESWNTNRRQYIADAIAFQGNYSIDIQDVDEIQFKAGVDGVNNRIALEDRKGTELLWQEERNQFLEEAFGEKRFSLGVMYLLKRYEFLQMALGYEFRFDRIGDDLSGKNSQKESGTHPIVSEVDYTNHTIFGEAMWDLSDLLSINLGTRWDYHTRTAALGGFLSPRIALIYKPNENHAIKGIYQTSANNGSADNYEYNRHSYDDEGNPYRVYHFEKPYELPGLSDPIPGVTEKELHSLEPEKATSYELTSMHRFYESVHLSPSISYNSISNLFAWSAPDNREINAGRYQFLNAEVDLHCNFNWVILGANHVHSRLVNTNVKDGEKTLFGPVFDKSKDWYETKVDKEGRTYYVPKATGKEEIIMNPLLDQVTVDGKNFLNLATDITKVYADIEIADGLVFHADARVFWGLIGRADIHQYKADVKKVTRSFEGLDTTYVEDLESTEMTMRVDSVYSENITWKYYGSNKNLNNPKYAALYGENQNFHYAGIHEDVMTKLNLSLHWTSEEDLEVSVYVYDVLAEPEGGNAIHSMRWQQMSSNDHTDLYTMDQRSYAIRVSKTF